MMTPLDDLREQAVKLRSMASLQEQLLGLDVAFCSLPERHEHFVRSSISLVRAAAVALDAAIDVHLATYAALNAPQPPPRPKLQVINGHDTVA